MRRFSTVRLPSAVIVVVAAALTAIMLGRPEAAIAAAPWAVMLVLGLTSTRRHGLRGRARLETDRVLVGDEVELAITVRTETAGWLALRPLGDNAGQVLLAGAAASAGRTAAAGSRRADAVASAVDRDRPTVINCRLPPPAWGAHDVGRVEVTLHERYGLFEQTGMLTEPVPLRVHPRPIDLNRLLGPWLVRRQSGVHDSTAADRGVELADIRPFGSGDALRDVNWWASARANELLVTQRHPDRGTDAVLLLDSFVESGHDVRTAVGLAVEAAVALAESHLSLSDRVGLVELGGVVRWVNPGTGRLQLHRLTDALLGTRLYANATDRDLTVLPRGALPPRSFVVALSPLLDQRFIDALHLLRASGHDVVVIECLYHTPAPGSLNADVARAAVAVFEAERAIVRSQLIERGVAIGQWRQGEHLDAVLAELLTTRRRLSRLAR
ncbi:MAG: DUF58 domain-containing protein [Acidimicrobiales bacterium]